MNASTRASAVLALLAASGFASAATLTVTKTADTNDGACNADCSLREAIVASNVTAAGDTIVVPAGTYTYTLGVMPTINRSLTIAGAGAATTILDGNQTGSVLHFGDTGGETGIISGVTITGGFAQNGAGILVNNYGTAILRKVTVRDNAGTATGSGGGLLVFPDTLVVEDSTLSGNSSRSGGAIFVNTNGTATLRNVTLSDNHAMEGSAIYANGAGGTFLTNVTITANEALPGGSTDGSKVVRIFSGDMTLKNTILFNNTPGSCFVQSNLFSGKFVSAGHNLDGDGTCGLTGTGDQTGTDPLLGALQDNGGPTFTHAQATGSPAIDAGTNIGCPAADQRGQPRPADGDANASIVCDIGALEVGGTTIVTTTPTGSNVQVDPVDVTTGTSPVSVTFSGVSEGGFTSLATSTTGTENPGFKLGNPPLYYELDTSAAFTPPVEVCIDYSGVTFTNENNLKLFHFVNGSWVNSTTSHDKVNDIICGTVGSLSPFGVFEDDADTEPDPFTFVDRVNVQPNKTQTSNAVTITGINAPAPISVSGGQYQIVGLTGWITTPGTITDGQQVQVRHVSGKPPNATTNTTLTVGGISDTFTTRTVPKKPR